MAGTDTPPQQVAGDVFIEVEPRRLSLWIFLLSCVGVLHEIVKLMWMPETQAYIRMGAAANTNL
jgi:hypothetical protein